LIIICPECGTKYRYDEARFGEAEVKQVRCAHCQHSFEVRNPIDDPADSTSVDISRTDAPQEIDKRPESTEPEAPELPELAPLRRDMRYSLAVIAGSQAGSVFPIDKPRVFLGRGSAMDVQIKDSEVSRKHAMLEVRNDDVVIVDLGATNGIWVGGERADEVKIDNHGEFTIGSTTLMLIITGSGGP
jgi:predicted Zn finger-like uncharacterized protein